MLRSVLFTTLLALSANAGAQGFDYDFLSVGYSRLNFDGGGVDVDGDGFGIAGSFEINESFFIAGNYSFGELEEQGVELDLDTLSAGIGWHTPLSDTVDFVTTLSYEYVEASALGFEADDNGIGLGVGLRFQASEVIEFNGGISYVDMSDGGSDTGFGLGVLYGVSETFDVGLSGDWADDVSAFGISGRLYFGR
jgi:hypothetical protein